MSDDLFFGSPRHAVAGAEAEEGAFIRSQAGPGMALHDPGNFFRKSHGAKKIRPLLGMVDRVRFAPADIMKQGRGSDKRIVCLRVVPGIPDGTVPDGPAVSDNFFAAPGLVQQVFGRLLLMIRHDPAIFLSTRYDLSGISGGLHYRNGPSAARRQGT